jgi:hypothetical protein
MDSIGLIDAVQLSNVLQRMPTLSTARLDIKISLGMAHTTREIFLLYNMYRSRDSSFGIATGYELEGRSTILGRGKRFFSNPQRTDQLWVPPSLPSIGYRGALSLALKRPMREADHSPPYSADINNVEAIPPLPHMSSWHSA